MQRIEAEVTIDVGEPFVLFISFENFKFGFKFNNDELEKYEIPRNDFVNLEEVISEGDMTVNFVGFTNPGNTIKIGKMLGVQSRKRTLDGSAKP